MYRIISFLLLFECLNTQKKTTDKREKNEKKN